MTRRPDWHSRLAAYLTEAGRKPFAEGSHDCALFAGGAVEAMTGTDPMADLRGRYATTSQGLQLLKSMGYGDHLAWFSAHLPPIRPPERPRAGDVACVPGHDGPSLGIVQGEAVYVLSPTGGLVFASLGNIQRAWRV